MSLASQYRGYIDCLNRQAWSELGRFVCEDVVHNDRKLGLFGYRDMLIADHRTIPDLCFNIGLLVCDPPHVAARLQFDCSPKGEFLGLAADGRKLTFSENVIYAFRDEKIATVWSVIDKAAVEAQLASR